MYGDFFAKLERLLKEYQIPFYRKTGVLVRRLAVPLDNGFTVGMWDGKKRLALAVRNTSTNTSLKLTLTGYVMDELTSREAFLFIQKISNGEGEFYAELE